MTYRSTTPVLLAAALAACNGSSSDPGTTVGFGDAGISSAGAGSTDEDDGSGTDDTGTTGAPTGTTSTSADSSRNTDASTTGTADSGTSGSVGPESESSTGGTTGMLVGGSSSSGGDEEPVGSSSGGEAPLSPLLTTPNLWYSFEDRLVFIEIDPDDGSVVRYISHTVDTLGLVFAGDNDGQNSLTMLGDGSLLGLRENANGSLVYHIPEPPLGLGDVDIDVIGGVPGDLRIEALYTDCQGAVYLIDTGPNIGTAEGNRLLRFTGDYLAGDLAFEEITDLSMASVADLDDMSPGISETGQITDGTGFAIDTGTVYLFDYNTGTGTAIGNGGDWGIHALGGPLFTDGIPRLYILDRDGRLFEADPETLTLSDPLMVGPPATREPLLAGWSGLAGPLTECVTTLPPAPQ